MTQHENDKTQSELVADAMIALEEARKLTPGPERAAAMKRAGSLRYAGDSRGLSFPKCGKAGKDMRVVARQANDSRIEGFARESLMLIAESFDLKTLYKMETALDRACRDVGLACELYDARRHIASKILECAQRGDQSLGGLTEAGRLAANELRVMRGL